MLDELRLFVFCLIAVLICPLVATAQNQFRDPDIPPLRSLGGKLISAPTKPRTTLQALVQDDRQQPTADDSGSQEYQFRETTAGQFQEITNQNSLRGTGQSSGAQLGGQIRPWEQDLNGADPPADEDPNFNGFTPRRSNTSGSFEDEETGSTFDSWDFEAAIENRFRDDSSSDSLEQLPPAINEVRSDDDPRTDKITQRYPNGNKRIVRSVAQDENGNFSNHGPWEAFDVKGNSLAAGVFKRGVMQGQWRRQHTKAEGGLFATKPFNLFEGPYLSVASFKDGKLNGLWTIYDRYRSKIFEITYVEGVRNGTATWWHPNRAKMREANFKDGLLHGMILGWDNAEKPTQREEYIEGRRIVRNVTFYRPKRPKQEEYFLDSKLEPEGKDNWWDAKPTPFLPRGSKVKNGGAAQWYENGQLKHQGQFKEGEAVGRFVWWHANGN